MVIDKILQNGKKNPCIPQNFYENNFIVEFIEKNEVINNFLAKQCSLLDNRNTCVYCPCIFLC